MSFMCRTLSTTKRPKLLVAAARHGARSYNRQRDLSRLIVGQPRATTDQIVESLAVQERLLDQDRRDKATTYSVARHIGVLSALLVEMRT